MLLVGGGGLAGSPFGRFGLLFLLLYSLLVHCNNNNMNIYIALFQPKLLKGVLQVRSLKQVTNTNRKIYKIIKISRR